MAQILIIEPDRLLARTYAEACKRAGYAVRACATAQGAVQLADDIRPDAVVLELQLVAHSGIEFLYEFRSYADWQTIPVVVHSNVPPTEFNDSVDVLKKHLHIASYYYKPTTNLETLLQAVTAALAPV
jgi:DNA-binding response OmpR family regulator